MDKYKEAIERLKQWDREHPNSGYSMQERDEFIFPELAESKDERIRKEIISMSDTLGRKDWIAWLEKQEGCEYIKKDWLEHIKQSWYKEGFIDGKYSGETSKEWTINDAATLKELIVFLENGTAKLQHDLTRYANWLKIQVTPIEKQGSQQLCMIQWKGYNLKEVIGFTGKDKNFDKWFASFEEYEKYVQEHNNVFKLFNEDGSHYEVPVGAWIIKTPDGYNTASRYVFRQKLAWSKEDREYMKSLLDIINGTPSLTPSEVECHKDWLKSLKDRVQPKQEWSEDDMKKISWILAALQNSTMRNSSLKKENEDAENWLKSLRPQSQWKPSNEQIKVCKEVYADILSSKGFDLGTVNSELNRLEEKLKKLKEL